MTSDHPSLQSGKPNGVLPSPNIQRGTTPVVSPSRVLEPPKPWTGQKFEYSSCTANGLTINLNSKGQDGWELVSVNYVSGVWYYDFKREIPRKMGRPRKDVLSV